MQIIEKCDDIYHLQQSLKKEDLSIALVATMGGLHQAHIDLVKKAQDLADVVCVSIFVNPTQFGPNEDFASYPRTLEEDFEKLLTINADVIFIPQIEDIYPNKSLADTTKIHIPRLVNILCGASRPDFFVGIPTVISSLFNLIQPDFAVFGEKDFQQLLIIKKMVAELHFPVEIHSIPITREADGLAMSSRNTYLTEEERKKAPFLYESLCKMREKIIQTNLTEYDEIIQEYKDILINNGFAIDYLQVCNQQDLTTADIDTAQSIILTAAILGKTRLLDNIKI